VFFFIRFYPRMVCTFRRDYWHTIWNFKTFVSIKIFYSKLFYFYTNRVWNFLNIYSELLLRLLYLPPPYLSAAKCRSVSSVQQKNKALVHLSWPTKYFKISPLSFPWFACNKWGTIWLGFSLASINKFCPQIRSSIKIPTVVTNTAREDRLIRLSASGA
jgi:hypothetical protein